MDNLSRRFILLSVALLAGCQEPTGPAPTIEFDPQFIVNGAVDGQDHANVGAFFVDRNGDGILNPLTEGGCSGFLAAPTIFVTAAHCLSGPAPEVLKRWVTFDASAATFSVSVIPVIEMTLHPLFEIEPGHDVGVLRLATAPPGIAPVTLPKKDLLGDVFGDKKNKSRKWVEGRDFLAVGYGVTLTAGPGSFCLIFQPYPDCFYLDGQRRSATAGFAGLDGAWLVLNQASAAGFGGLCFGDSGSPLFLGASDVAVAVGTGVLGGAPCQEAAIASRLDTKATRKFLKKFVRGGG